MRASFLGLLLIFGLVLMFSSCSSSNDVASSHFLQKRKHRPGVHLNWSKKHYHTKQHAQAQKGVCKAGEEIELADKGQRGKPIKAISNPVTAKHNAEPIQPKKLIEQLPQVIAKRPVLQKNAPIQLKIKSTKKLSHLDEGDPIEKDSESKGSRLGTLALIAGAISLCCLLLAALLFLTALASIAFIPFLLALVAGLVGLITGSLSMNEDQRGKIGLILSLITIGAFTLLSLILLGAVLLLVFFFLIFLGS